MREERNWKPLKAGAFMQTIGPIEMARDADGGSLFALETTEAHANLLGLVHGGTITALLDQVIATVAWNAADRAPCVTVQMDTRFVGASEPGTRLEARAVLRQKTGSMLFLDAEVVDGKRSIALASAVMKIIRKAM
ncbi:PaaI family thioesterase [Celeribacter baekdonensis]|uniref:PaaI family thioesterase n=1 Tax=Celeribacter baekdonensis TaxID=875171 RepID=UPI003A94DB07